MSEFKGNIFSYIYLSCCCTTVLNCSVETVAAQQFFKGIVIYLKISLFVLFQL